MQQAQDSSLVGREVELRTLRLDLAAIGTGRVRVVAIEGEAGIGRARLLSAAVAIARDQGFEVLAGRPGVDEGERARLLGDAALARASGADPEVATALAEEARSAGERLGDDLTQSIALSALATADHLRTRPRESLEHARHAWALALRSDGQEAGLRPTAVWLGGMVRFHAGDWDDAVTELPGVPGRVRGGGQRDLGGPSGLHARGHRAAPGPGRAGPFDNGRGLPRARAAGGRTPACARAGAPPSGWGSCPLTCRCAWTSSGSQWRPASRTTRPRWRGRSRRSPRGAGCAAPPASASTAGGWSPPGSSWRR